MPGPVNKALDRVEETTRIIVRALRHALERGRFTADDAADIAIVQLFRPGGPSKYLSAQHKARLREAVVKLAAAIADVTRPRDLLHFARSASETAWHLATTPRHPGARIEEVADADYRTLARAALYATALQARDSEDHVARAVARAVRERKRKRGIRNVPLDDGDPLRTLLELPATGRVALPKNDLRIKIADAAKASGLGMVLRQAARFAEDVVRPAIGEELWSIGRPVAFADKRETRVIFEVKSTLLAHEATLRSQELVHRLKKLPHFKDVDGVKVNVVQPPALQPLK